MDETEWNLSRMRDRVRAQRLLRAMRPEDLIDHVAHEAMDDKLSVGATWRWQSGTGMIGCGRAIVVIPVTEETFDDLINGRCGYRAQYYLSVEVGRQFNDTLVTALCTAAKQIYERDPKPPRWEIVERSIRGPYSKLWVYGDSAPFKEAPKGEFLPRRWAPRAHTVWLTAPRPQRPAIDLKGTWLDDNDRSHKLDLTKADRDQVLHEGGGA